MISPQTTYFALLIVQALHLLHHRITKRHISFAEVVSAMVLCIPWWAPIPALLMMGTHVTLISIQIVGSIWIRTLSPDWNRPSIENRDRW
jgi:hypothetical protein